MDNLQLYSRNYECCRVQYKNYATIKTGILVTEVFSGINYYVHD